MRGDLHLHDLGFIDRPYCSGQSLEYIKKFGLNLPNSLSMAKPAKHPEVLLAHMVKFAAALQSNFAGAIGWDAINLFFAPYLEGLSDREVHQLAQMLIYEFSQQAVARGGQAIFTDINLYWEVPKHFENVMAIGPGGEFTGKTYAEYASEAQRFVWALFDVYREGDAVGRPFFFPKPLVHITEKFFQTPGHMDFLQHICDVAGEKGNTYFVFDRGNTAKVSECCRLSFKLEQSDLEDAQYPWRMRYCALQNVTLNLPRIAYQCAGDDTKLFAKILEVFNKAVRAHLEKKNFLERLLALGDNGPLALLTMNKDGMPYLRMHRVTNLIGWLG
jgi:ribonucleoside-triphosphate reductase